jgi:tetratricopeptide (TPR) repeat protein
VSLNRFDEAEMIYKSVDANAPQFWQAGNELGNMYLLQGRIKEAIPYFEKGIGYFKEKGAAFANLGYAYYYLGDIEKAQENWESSIAHEDNADVFSNLGTIYYQQRKFSRAIEMYKKAIAISPNVATFWGNLADAYYFSNDLEKANINYVKASELAELALTNNDKDIESLTTLALYRARLGKHNQAKGLVKRAIDLAPQEINVLYYASVVYLQTKEYEQAWLYLENALDKGYPLDLVIEAPEFMEHISSTKFDEFREKMTQ